MSDLNLILNRQINRWNKERDIHKEVKKENDKAKPMVLNPVVTLSSQCGCRGDEIGKLLAHELNYGLFDKQIVDYIAQHMGVRSALVESLDEHDRSELDLWIEGMLKQHVVDHDDYLHALIEIVKTIHLQGSTILVGRGANFILQGTNAIRVRIIAPIENRIRCLCDFRGMSETEAQKEIKRLDEERAHFIKRYFHKNIDDPLGYDMVINVEKLTIDAVVKSITAVVNTRRRVAA